MLIFDFFSILSYKWHLFISYSGLDLALLLDHQLDHLLTVLEFGIQRLVVLPLDRFEIQVQLRRAHKKRRIIRKALTLTGFLQFGNSVVPLFIIDKILLETLL